MSTSVTEMEFRRDEALKLIDEYGKRLQTIDDDSSTLRQVLISKAHTGFIRIDEARIVSSAQEIRNQILDLVTDDLSTQIFQHWFLGYPVEQIVTELDLQPERGYGGLMPVEHRISFALVHTWSRIVETLEQTLLKQ